MTTFLDNYEDTESNFTFDRASKKASRTGENHDSDNAFLSGIHERGQRPGLLNSDNSVSLDDRNRTFTGLAIGVPLSLLLWVGIFSLLYLNIH